MHKAGFVNIIGSPNVGKSTLMNQLVGERISIITSKAQTTRHRIMGIVNGEDFQIVYSDTPGIVDPSYRLHEGMMDFVSSALIDADILLILVDPFENQFKNEKILNRVNKLSIPKILVLNKIDLIDQSRVEELFEHWNKQIPGATIIPTSALHALNVEQVLKAITDNLPESPAYFPKDEMTDKPARFFVNEFIREKIFIQYKKEIPYSCEIVTESFKEEENIIRIRSEIMVERTSQKGIIIGHKGAAIKKVGIAAREDLEAFFGKKVHLELFVKVDKDWRKNELKLKKYGYLN